MSCGLAPYDFLCEGPDLSYHNGTVNIKAIQDTECNRIFTDNQSCRAYPGFIYQQGLYDKLAGVNGSVDLNQNKTIIEIKKVYFSENLK